MGNVAANVYVNAFVLLLLWCNVVVANFNLLCISLLPCLCHLVACIELNAEILCGFGEYYSLGERTAAHHRLGCCLPLVEESAVVVLVYHLAAGYVNDAEMLFAVVERIDERYL